MAEVVGRIANFSPEKIRQLAQRLNKGKADAGFKIPRRSEGTPACLSFGQERLWFLDQLSPGSPAYNLPFAIRVRFPDNFSVKESEVDINLLNQRTVEELVRRHEVLRTCFPAVDGAPVPIVAPPGRVPIAMLDMNSVPEAHRAETAKRVVLEDAHKPFDLARGPLCRFGMIRFANNDYVGFCTFHHIVVDGWSQKILIQEYQSLLFAVFTQTLPSLGGKMFRPVELPIQYGDYAVWQRQRLQGEVWNRLSSYWIEQLDGLSDLEFPTDYPRPAVQSFRGASEQFFLEKSFCDSVRQLGANHAATLSTTLLATWAALLMRYSGETDVAVCIPVANRTHVETEGLIGFFVNTLVVRMDLSGNPTFRELLERVREATTNAYAHQEMPFERLVQELQPSRDLSRNPLSRIAFQYIDFPAMGPDPGTLAQSIDITPLEVDTGTSVFDLQCYLWGYLENPHPRHREGIHGTITYNTDLFEQTTAQRIRRHFQSLLEAVVTSPNSRLSELPLLEEKERHQMLREWNATQRDYGESIGIAELFEQQAELLPEAVAAECGKAQITYAELNGCANRLAHQLRKLGVGPEVRVALCMERGLDLLVALLGILKAGGAYVPLDPNYPSQRLQFMLADSHAAVLIVEERVQSKVGGFNGPILRTDKQEFTRKGELASNLPTIVQPHNLAYLIYTSGSTGFPKGVAIQHASAVTLLRWAIATFSLEQLACVLASTSVCFDLSVFEIFAPLSCGCRVVVVDNVLSLSSAALSGEVTLVNTVPSAMAELLRMGPLPSSVNTVCLAGEPLSCALVRLVYSNPNVLAVWNLYGPSEDTTYSTAALVQRSDLNAPSIGRPVANTQVYLLDENMNPVPCGVTGNLYIGGEGLARGYLGRPDLTASVFGPNPYSDTAGARLYRTGDLARYRPDGTIAFLGRKDHQLKLRGFRIELGEIESLLAQHPGVQEAAVIGGHYHDGQRLVAYVVKSSNGALSGQDLRQYMRERLPDYMVPAAIVPLDRLPVTANGKLDRKALAVMELSSENLDASVAPRTPLEQKLAEIWTEVLHLDRIGVHDSFFDLGGHSLLATRLLSRLRSSFEVDVPLRKLFETPTVAGLAETIEAAKSLRSTGEFELRAVARDGAVAPSFAQQRLWFLDQLQPGNPMYNIPIALRIEGPLDASLLERSLNQIVSRHEALRTRFIMQDGELLQQVSLSSPVNLPLMDLSWVAEPRQAAEVKELLQEQAQQPFDLEHGPLFRAQLIRLISGQHVLALNMHHIVSDGWSLHILVRELVAFYQAGLKKEAGPVPALPIQYADFALWQRQWLQGGKLEQQLSYWSRELANLPVLELPLDFPRPAVRNMCGSRISRRLRGELVKDVRQLGRKHDATLFMNLLAVFGVLLLRYSGAEDLGIGTPVANRNREQIEGLIGFFVNTLVMRADLRGDPTFTELLGRVRETALAAYAHPDLPFEMLVEELKPQRQLSHTPLFQVMFALQSEPLPKLKVADLSFTPLRVETGTVKFDLLMTIEEVNAEELVVHMDYSTELFKAATIERMLGHFQNLLQSAVENPEAHLSEIAILGEEERRQISQGWNTTELDSGLQESLPVMFQLQVERTPFSTAVEYEQERLCYGELNQRANQLARYLRRLGVGPEVRVALFLARGLDMIVALMGVLKAGGGYVPLDPESPAERLAFILRETEASLVITQQSLLKFLPESQVLALCLEEKLSGIRQESTENLAISIDGRNLAYVIYTSGSTGGPKGVCIEHDQLANYMRAILRRIDLCRRVATTQPITFDACLTALIGPLLSGGTVHVLSTLRTQSPVDMAQYLQEKDIEILKLAPSLFMTLQGSSTASLMPKRTLVLGGEASKWNWVQDLRRAAPACSILNQYGPTETAIGVSTFTVDDSAAGLEYSLTPLGKPLAGVQIYVLDEQMQPVPIGMPGELYVGGYCVGRGYLDRPDLTAQRFLPDPFIHKAGSRMYRTGDRGRYLADGNLEFLGRTDQQVKVRGFRVELEEIEVVLGRHPAVEQAAVLATTAPGAGVRLAAYAVTRSDASTNSHDLRQYLRDHLPEYMVPAAVTLLEQMPLTASGKIDRQALLSITPKASQESFVAPRDRVELQLVRIWEEVLGVQSIGVRDDFFDLGGHSLLAIRLMARIRACFGRDLPLITLFQASTVEQLAERVRREAKESENSPLVLIQPGGDLSPLFLVHPIGGHVLCYYQLARQLGTERPIYGLEARIQDATLPSIPQMAAAYLQCIRVVQTSGPYFLGGWSIGGIIAFEMAQQLAAAGHEVRTLALIDSSVPDGNNPAKPLPLLRALEIHAGMNLSISENDFEQLDREDQLHMVLTEMKRKNLAPPGADVSYIRRYVHAIEHNLRAKRDYVPVPYPGEILLLHAQEPIDGQPDFDIAIAVDSWRLLAQSLVTHSISGNHVTMMNQPHVGILAERLQQYLEQGKE